MQNPWYTINQIKGHIAMWAIRQHPYHNPPGLMEVLENFQRATLKDFDKVGMIKFDDMKSMKDFLSRKLIIDPKFCEWNVPRSGHKFQFVSCSAFDQPKPEHDLIDLDALVTNCVMSLRLENSTI